ncbi:hypothetical protein M404DRAFT_28390, partial [Pisolithus tinctorius Marx 270]
MSLKPISFLFDWSFLTGAEGCTPVCWAGAFFSENEVFRLESVSKKCKCSEARDDAKASLVLSTQPKSQLGPVLANFPSVKPSKSTTFSCYQTTDDKKAVGNSDDAEFVDLPTLLAGETDSVAFHSANQATGCRYLVGVHDKKLAKPLSVRHLSTSLHRLEARVALGESFGTKKAKLAIKAQERNKVDVSAMETVVDHLQESIQKSTQALPSKGSLFRSLYIASTYLRGSSEEAQATADSTRLVPPYNAEATVPSEVYPLHNIIPETEWKTLSEAPFLVVGQNQRIPLLP